MNEKYGKLFPRCPDMEERKIWQTGKGSYVTALPPEWAKPLLESKNRKIFVSKAVCNSIHVLFLTPKESYKTRKLMLEIKKDDPDMLLYEIVTAYLKDYDEVYVKFPKGEPKPKCVRALSSVQSKLFGVTVRSHGNDFKVTMSTKPESIDDLLDDMFMLYEDLYNINYEIMNEIKESTISKEKLDGQGELIETKESDIDACSFLIKRLLNRLLYTPWLSTEIGVKDFADIIPYTTLNVNLERLGDLQVEIFNALCALIKSVGENAPNYIHSKSNSYGYLEYYSSAHRMVKDSYRSRNDVERLKEIISTKNKRKTLKKDDVKQEMPYRPGYIEAEERMIIYDLIKNFGNEHLVCLEHEIWGMTGNATNIAEAWYNMKGFSTITNP